MSRMKDLSDVDTHVDIIACNYEWICPICESLCHEREYIEEVKCIYCRHTFKTNVPEHAYK